MHRQLDNGLAMRGLEHRKRHIDGEGCSRLPLWIPINILKFPNGF